VSWYSTTLTHLKHTVVPAPKRSATLVSASSPRKAAPGHPPAVRAGGDVLLTVAKAKAEMPPSRR